LRQGWGVNKRRGQKSQFQHGRKRFGQESKLQQSGKERGQILSNSCQKLSKKCQKVVKKLSKNADKDKLTEGRVLSPDVALGKNWKI
jgi:hypothetical protein